jgi:hypothetical protein
MASITRRHEAPGEPSKEPIKGKPLGSRALNRRAGQRGKRHAPPQSPSSTVAESYRLGALANGTLAQRLEFFGQLGRTESLSKGLARLSPRMSRRLRRRSVAHLKDRQIREEFKRGQARLGG